VTQDATMLTTMDNASAGRDPLATRIAGLVCPRCQHPLALAEDLTHLAPGRRHGIVACPCSAYPLTCNILSFGGKHGVGTRQAVRHLRGGRLAAAIACQVEAELSFHGLGWKVLRHLSRRSLMPDSVVTMARERSLGDFAALPTFQAMVERLKLGKFGDYLVRRCALPSWFAGLALCRALGARAPRHIVDLGCGAGHYEYALTRCHPQAEITAIDQYFSLLFLAQKFAAHDRVLYLCQNLSHASPLQQPYDVLFTSDTLTRLSVGRAGVLDYIAHLAKGGLLVAPRLDTAWGQSFERPLPYWRETFGALPHRFFDENHLAAMAADDDSFSLARLEREQNLEKAKALFVIAGQEVDLETLSATAYSATLINTFDRWVVNPAYGPATAAGNQMVFHRQDDFPMHLPEWEATVKPRLPAVLELDRETLVGRTFRHDATGLRDWVRQGIATLSSDFGGA